MLEVPEVTRCMPLCMLKVVEGGLCVWEVLEVPEVMCCVLLCLRTGGCEGLTLFGWRRWMCWRCDACFDTTLYEGLEKPSALIRLAHSSPLALELTWTWKLRQSIPVLQDPTLRSYFRNY